jgi:hypothetical protein
MSMAKAISLLLAVTVATGMAPLVAPDNANTLAAQDTTVRGAKRKDKADGDAKAGKPKAAKPVPATAADSARARQEKVAKDSVEAERLPLFADEAPLPFTLIANFKLIGRDRDSTSRARYPGTLVVQDTAGSERRIPVQLRTRGHFRLKRSTCSFVNLQVAFPDRKSLQGTPFADQKALKLGAHCQEDARYENVLRREYLAYRIFNVVTPRSFRARLATGTYVDSASGKTLTTRVAMFLEHDDHVAARQGGKMREFRRALFADMEPVTLDQMSLFEYLIGNTDFSIYALHNVRLAVTEGGRVLPLAYDFDFSGLVSAPYSSPPPQLPIRTVRERLYRGPCRSWAELEPSVRRFTEREAEILALVDRVPGLPPNDAREVRDYLKGFFQVANDPKQAQHSFINECVKKPGI